MKQQNYNSKSLLVSVFFGLLFVILLNSITSCSARKVNKSTTDIKENTKTEIATIDSSKTITTSQNNILIVDSSSSDEFTITPIDSTKEMIVAGTKYKNAVLKHKKSVRNKVVDKTETIAKTEQKAIKTNIKSDKSKSTNIEIKNTERKSNYWWMLWFLLIIPIYIAYKKYKDKIWFI